MPVQKIPYPASTTGGVIEVEIPDTITVTNLTVDIPNQFSFKVTENTPLPEEPPTTDPDLPQTGYELTATENWDKLSDLNFNQIGVTSETASLAKYFSTTITKDSPGSFKSIVPKGGNSLSSGNRSEQQFNDANGRPKASHNPIEGAYDYWAYYENWFNVRGQSGHTFQTHPYTGGASANLSIQNYNGIFDIIRSLKGQNTKINKVSKSVVPNTWIHHRIEFKFSTGQDGYIRVWIDGDLICDYKGATADGSGQYVKCGQNKWGSMPTESVVYYDQFKVYRKV